jgi:hypothetical protein
LGVSASCVSINCTVKSAPGAILMRSANHALPWMKFDSVGMGASAAGVAGVVSGQPANTIANDAANT